MATLFTHDLHDHSFFKNCSDFHTFCPLHPCRLNSESTTSTVVIRQETRSNQVKPPHVALAGSKVWLALGQVWLAANEPDASIICAKAGLEELGDEYATPFVEDDTDLKLILAEERIQEGHLSDGAKMMLRVLENRLLLYEEYKEEIGD